LPASAPHAATKPAIKVLYVESDENVLASQTDQWKKAGFHVTTVSNRQQTQDTLRRDAFDLVILGATLSKDDRHHLPYMVKKAHAGTKVLVMHASSHHHEVDLAIDANTSMNFVLEKIDRLMAEHASV
jgi:DNA-binding NtrC family response regulator